MGANIFLIVEKSPLDFRNSSILASVLIPLPDTPIFPTPSPDGITHAKILDTSLDQNILLPDLS